MMCKHTTDNWITVAVCIIHKPLIKYDETCLHLQIVTSEIIHPINLLHRFLSYSFNSKLSFFLINLHTITHIETKKGSKRIEY